VLANFIQRIHQELQRLALLLWILLLPGFRRSITA